MGKSWWQKALDSGYYERRGYECEYPFGTGFVPADKTNYREEWRDMHTINRVVIHITGGTNVGSAINTFAAEHLKVKKQRSAHYIVARDGKVYQTVWEKDRAFHAGSANGDSIGIEHAASNKEAPTLLQYLVSSHLTKYLCHKYIIPINRMHILGHQEAVDTNHNCPGPLWDWPTYIQRVANMNPYYHPLFGLWF